MVYENSNYVMNIVVVDFIFFYFFYYLVVVGEVYLDVFGDVIII